MHFLRERFGGQDKFAWQLVLFKIAYLSLVWVALLIWSHYGPEAEFRAKDAKHYLHLSDVGYLKGDIACAFYPLWPLLIRWFSILTGGSHLLSGMILANFLSLAALVMLFKMICRRMGEPVARRSLFFMLLFPGSIFFQLVYTEGLFLFLVMLLCLGLQRGAYKTAFVAALLLPLTKAVGIFCIFPILWHFVAKSSSTWRLTVTHRCLGGKNTVITTEQTNGQSSVVGARWDIFVSKGYWLLLAPIYGLEIYFLLMWSWTGNPLEGFEAQKHWGVQSISKLFNVPQFINGLLTPTGWHTFRGSLLDRCSFILLLWFLPTIWRLDKGWFLWTLMLGVVPAVTGTFTPYMRYESPVFPLFIALAAFWGKPNRIVLRWAIILVFGAGHAFLLWRFVRHGWVG